MTILLNPFPSSNGSKKPPLFVHIASDYYKPGGMFVCNKDLIQDGVITIGNKPNTCRDGFHQVLHIRLRDISRRVYVGMFLLKTLSQKDIECAIKKYNLHKIPYLRRIRFRIIKEELEAWTTRWNNPTMGDYTLVHTKDKFPYKIVQFSIPYPAFATFASVWTYFYFLRKELMGVGGAEYLPYALRFVGDLKEAYSSVVLTANPHLISEMYKNTSEVLALQCNGPFGIKNSRLSEDRNIRTFTKYVNLKYFDY